MGPKQRTELNSLSLLTRITKPPPLVFCLFLPLVQPHLIVCGCNSEKGIVSLGLELCHYLHYWSPSSLALTSAFYLTTSLKRRFLQRPTQILTTEGKRSGTSLETDLLMKAQELCRLIQKSAHMQ